jgi:membrane-bound lytic murein transglycosylase F
MRLFFIAILCSSIAACNFFDPPVLPVSKGKELVVLTINSPTTYFENAEGNYAGLE